MIGQHSLILLDEVLSGLDQEMKKKAISKIKEKSKNSILIIISHENEIQETCDGVFSMSKNYIKITNKICTKVSWNKFLNTIELN